MFKLLPNHHFHQKDVIAKLECNFFFHDNMFSIAYVPNLPFWRGGPRFERAAPVFPVLPEISHFQMILAWISNTYKFFKSITIFTNTMWKSWLLKTKLGACVALIHRSTHCFGISKRTVRKKFEKKVICNF